MKFSHVFPLAVIGLVLFPGCETFRCCTNGENTRGAPSWNEETPYLRSIAGYLGLDVSNERTAEDLRTDIRLAIDNASLSVPAPLDGKTVETLKQCLSEEEALHLDKINEALKKMHGRDIYAFPGKARAF